MKIVVIKPKEWVYKGRPMAATDLGQVKVMPVFDFPTHSAEAMT